MDRAEVPSDVALHKLARMLAEILREHGQTLATAESCTGGWIAKLMTDVPGSSAWFEGGVVVYSNEAKKALLGVSPVTLEKHGAVSRETALEMVSGSLARFGASVAVAVTGVAGPAGGTADKPVGTVWIAWQQRGDHARAEEFHFNGDRDAVRRHAVATAMEGLRKILTG